MKKAFVGVDVGGTNTVIGVFDESRSLILKKAIPTLNPSFPEKTDSPDMFYDSLSEEILKLVREAKCDGGLAAVGMGVPGRVDPVRGIVLGASNLAWYDVPFAEEMSRRLGVTVRIDNDVRIYTLGEMAAGAGKGFKNLICLTVGTGIAAGVVIDGNIVRGSGWYAGEIGHDAVQGQNTLCNCGKRGCMETIVSARGVSRLANEAVLSGRRTSLSRLQRKPTPFDVYQACLNDDQEAKEIFRFVGEVLGTKLLTAIYLLNPEAIIIGGGVSEAGEYLLQPVREVIYSQYAANKPLVVAAQLGDSAGLIGSVNYAMNQNSGS